MYVYISHNNEVFLIAKKAVENDFLISFFFLLYYHFFFNNFFLQATFFSRLFLRLVMCGKISDEFHVIHTVSLRCSIFVYHYFSFPTSNRAKSLFIVN